MHAPPPLVSPQEVRVATCGALPGLFLKRIGHWPAGPGSDAAFWSVPCRANQPIRVTLRKISLHNVVYCVKLHT